MKKKIFALTLSLALCFGVTGCAAPFSKLFPVELDKLGEFNISNEYIDLVVISTDNTSNFGITEVAYDRNTGVMYFIKRSGYQFGISPIYNSDGTVKLYDGK